MEAGIRSLVCSGAELELLRKEWPDCKLIVPGLRMPGDHASDQKRRMSFGEALAQGADYLVLGRALSTAKDWEDQWEKIKSSLEGMY